MKYEVHEEVKSICDDRRKMGGGRMTEKSQRELAGADGKHVS